MTGSKVQRLREQAKKLQAQIRDAEAEEKERAAARAKARLNRLAKQSGLTKILANNTTTSAVLEKEFRALVERLEKAEEDLPEMPDGKAASPAAAEPNRSRIFNR